MGSVYGEPVDVQSRDDGRPVRFVWRGRLYTVRAIVAHSVINAERPSEPVQEYWRVEASPGQGVPAGAYEMRRYVAADTWTIRRVSCLLRHRRAGERRTGRPSAVPSA